MSLCNIVRLRVMSCNEKTVVYCDYYSNEKIIILHKEYSEVSYHDYSNDIHICYEINNSEKLFIEYRNRCIDYETAIKELINNNETMTEEYIKEVDYLNGRIETLKKEYNKKMTENYDLNDKIQSLQYDNNLYSNQLDEMNSKVAYYETEYCDIVAEKMQQYEKRCTDITEHAMRIIAKQKNEINQLNKIIGDRDLVIETMKKRINHLYKTIRLLKKA